LAKYERSFRGDFNEALSWIHNDIISGSASASYEDGSDFSSQLTRVAVRVYERYSMAGGNRVSLNITLIEEGNMLFLSAITSGGSQAVFFKINTFGEESFLRQVENSVESYISSRS
jgi:hypothetical protein